MTLLVASSVARTMALVVRSSAPATWQTPSTKARASANRRRSLEMVNVHGAASDAIPSPPGSEAPRHASAPMSLNYRWQAKRQQVQAERRKAGGVVAHSLREWATGRQAD